MERLILFTRETMKDKTKDDHLYIKLLEFANTRDKFTYADLMEECNLQDDPINESQIRRQISNGKLFCSVHEKNKAYSFYNLLLDKKDSIELWMSVDDKFRLLEYVELNEARESSLKATKQASIAILFSFVSFVVSIGFSIYGIYTSKEDEIVDAIKANSSLLQEEIRQIESKPEIKFNPIIEITVPPDENSDNRIQN